MWKLLFGKKQEAVPHAIPGDGRFRFAIVGESRYQKELENICGGRRKDGAEHITEAVLIAEDENPADRNAIRVDVRGRTVGYLSRQDAFLYRERVRVGSLTSCAIQCRAKVRGGWDRGGENRGHFGVWLDADFRPPKDRYPCPYCQRAPEPTPLRSKKCPHCQGQILVRNS